MKRSFGLAMVLMGVFLLASCGESKPSYLTKEAVDLSDPRYFSIANELIPYGDEEFSSSLRLDDLKAMGFASYEKEVTSEDGSYLYTIDPITDYGYMLGLFHKSEEGSSYWMEDGICFYGYGNDHLKENIHEGMSMTEVMDLSPNDYYRGLQSKHLISEDEILWLIYEQEKGGSEPCVKEIHQILVKEDDYKSVLSYMTAEDKKAVTESMQGKNKINPITDQYKKALVKGRNEEKQPVVTGDCPKDPSLYASSYHIVSGEEEGLAEGYEAFSLMKFNKLKKEDIDPWEWQIVPLVACMGNRGYSSFDTLKEAGALQYVHYLKDSPWFYTIDPLEDGGYLCMLFLVRPSAVADDKVFDIRAYDAMIFHGFADKEAVNSLKAGDPWEEISKADPYGFGLTETSSVHRFSDGSMYQFIRDEGSDVIKEAMYLDDYYDLNVLNFMTEEDLGYLLESLGN